MDQKTQDQIIQEKLKDSTFELYEVDEKRGCILLGFKCQDNIYRGLTIFPVGSEGKLGFRVVMSEGTNE